MSKLLKFLKPYAGAVLAILCVLIVQAYCDLSLPTYTSEIVNVAYSRAALMRLCRMPYRRKIWITCCYLCRRISEKW